MYLILHKAIFTVKQKDQYTSLHQSVVNFRGDHKPVMNRENNV